ncbi:MAG: hypothetical protein JO359_13485, partial [Candidatus Eremiobacteraeota bacterium]|nr:hypothetical protein [Candidatus Eremiobacteraeota bacterium]
RKTVSPIAITAIRAKLEINDAWAVGNSVPNRTIALPTNHEATKVTTRIVAAPVRRPAFSSNQRSGVIAAKYR